MGTYSSYHRLLVRSYTNHTKAFPRGANWGIFSLSMPLLEGNCMERLMSKGKASFE